MGLCCSSSTKDADSELGESLVSLEEGNGTDEMMPSNFFEWFSMRKEYWFPIAAVVVILIFATVGIANSGSNNQTVPIVSDLDSSSSSDDDNASNDEDPSNSDAYDSFFNPIQDAANNLDQTQQNLVTSSDSPSETKQEPVDPCSLKLLVTSKYLTGNNLKVDTHGQPLDGVFPKTLFDIVVVDDSQYGLENTNIESITAKCIDSAWKFRLIDKTGNEGPYWPLHSDKLPKVHALADDLSEPNSFDGDESSTPDSNYVAIVDARE
eukprot:180291_1